MVQGIPSTALTLLHCPGPNHWLLRNLITRRNVLSKPMRWYDEFLRGYWEHFPWILQLRILTLRESLEHVPGIPWAVGWGLRTSSQNNASTHTRMHAMRPWCWEHRPSTRKEWTGSYLLSSYTKINPEWITDLTAGPRTMNFLENNMGDNDCSPRVG